MRIRLLALLVCAAAAASPTEPASAASKPATGKFSTAPGATPQSASLAKRLREAYEAKGPEYEPRTEHLHSDGQPVYLNRLILEDSPYLIQHAHNPVDWFPWGPEAFAKAQREDKPIFLSIGYSTCHWCHVMEEESFDDEEVARLLNEHFVAIKVDREQRPDVDDVYMTAVQLTTGRGGWPMSSLLTSDGKPFFGGTYYPRDTFIELLNQAIGAWHQKRPEVLAQGDRLAKAVAKVTAAAGEAVEVGDDVLASAVAASLAAHDPRFGGFSRAPKFPHESELLFLLQRAMRTGDRKALQAVTDSLDHMARGGIYDQVGGGFHRYSVDERWLVPHFEKMLYNQAHLARAYLEAWRLTGDALHERVVRQTLDYVLRDMTSPRGAFFSATDADSEGHEGTFFVWTPAELRRTLPPQDAELAIRLFGVTEGGNFEGKSILHLPKSLPESAAELELSLQDVLARLDRIRQRLYEEREKREHPLRDEKIVTAWNAMMVTTLARAGHALDEPRYLTAAEKAAEFLWQHNRRRDGRLWRAHLAGNSSVDAGLGDYAYLGEALLTLYDVTREAHWLSRARALADTMLELFWDNGRGGFFMSADDHDGRLLVRPKSPMDGAMPSGNSVALRTLTMLAARTGEPLYRQRAEGTLAAFSSQLRRQPTSFAYMLLGTDQLLRGEAGLVELGGRGVVRAEVVPIPAEPGRIEVRIDLAPGWHINGNRPLQKRLIATRLALAEDLPGLRLGAIRYPEARTVVLDFQEEPLSVYEGSVAIRATLSGRGAGRPLVAPLRLTVQPCDDRKCLRPEDLELEVPLAAIGESRP